MYVYASIWVLCLCVLAINIGTFVWKSFKLRAFRGPLALPLVGNMYTAEAFAFLKYFGKLRKKYGKWYVFWTFAQPLLVCCEPSAVREVLSDTKTFVKGEDYTKTFSLAFGEGLVTSVGEKHKNDRARVGKYFMKSSVCQFLAEVNRHTRKAIRTMIGEAGEKVVDATIDFEHFFSRLTLRVFGEFCMHHDFSQDEDAEGKICHAVSTGSFLVGLCIGTGVPLWRGLPWAEFIIRARNTAIKIFHPIVEARKEAISNGGVVVDDPLTAMLKDNVNQQDLENHMITLVSAGHDTTTYFCSYMVYLLAKHPEAQEKLREEIVGVMGSRDEVTEEDTNKFVYMRKVMQETLRLYTVIPAVTRVATKEVTFKESNVVVPKGTNIFVPLIVMNRDPELWDSPEKFLPDRWEDSMSVFQNPKIGYLPFGYGSRSCIGGNLATMESTVFLVHLLQHFRLQMDGSFRPAIRAGISLTTSNGMQVKVSSI